MWITHQTLATSAKLCFHLDMKSAILNEVVKRAGSANAVAEACGITVQAVYLWRCVPAKHCLAVEALTGINRKRLRPDIYGAPRERPKRPGRMLAALA